MQAGWKNDYFLVVEGVLVVVEALLDVPPFFGGFLDVSCFLGVLLVSAAGLAGFWANVKGMVANANAIASTIVFIEVLLLGGPVCPLTDQ